MNRTHKLKLLCCCALLASFCAVMAFAPDGHAQLPDKTVTPNAAGEGINKSYSEQVGAGRGDVMTPGSSSSINACDPLRSIRRGRQIFQRKFTRSQGVGPLFGDGLGNIEVDLAIGAGLSDSFASCHGRPRGAAGFGGDVVTRPDSRNSPHLFGIGLREIIADEMTSDLRTLRSIAAQQAAASGADVTLPLASKLVSFGTITAHADGTFDT